MALFYVHKNYGNAIFVKTKKYFEAQGGLNETWGKTWKPIEADSIKHARDKAKLLDIEEKFFEK